MTKRVATDVDETVTTSKLVAPPRPLSLDVNASQRAQPERQVATTDERGLAIKKYFSSGFEDEILVTAGDEIARARPFLIEF